MVFVCGYFPSVDVFLKSCKWLGWWSHLKPSSLPPLRSRPLDSDKSVGLFLALPQSFDMWAKTFYWSSSLLLCMNLHVLQNYRRKTNPTKTRIVLKQKQKDLAEEREHVEECWDGDAVWQKLGNLWLFGFEPITTWLLTYPISPPLSQGHLLERIGRLKAD